MAEATINSFARTQASSLSTNRPFTSPHQNSESVLTSDEVVGPQRFMFTGTGSEYFRIWVVNLLLTLATLGIYSAWAKVRRLQYFYRNTRVAGAVFDYHGQPKTILKGRILALVLVVAYKISFDISATVGLVVASILVGVMPWLLARSFRFKLANSSYRGLSFRFRGTVGQAYRMLILFPVMLFVIGLFVWSLVTSFAAHPSAGVIILILVLVIVPLSATLPLAHYLLKRYQHDNADFGQAPFFFYGRMTGFFKIYGKSVGFLFLGSVPAGIFGMITAAVFKRLQETSFGWLFGLLYGVASAYAFYLLVRAYLESRVQNYVWNNTELSDCKFESTVRARKLVWIHASNLVMITLTLGLYKPFAAVRLMKYRVENMTLITAGHLDEFFSDQSSDKAGALGQEAGDLFDIDIAL